MAKKSILQKAVLVALVLAVAFATTGFTNKRYINDHVIKVAAATYPMEEIVKIAAKQLEKKGYKVEISLLTDYVTANIGLNAGDFDANFHQHEPFMQMYNKKANGTLVKVAPIYDVYVGFYSPKYKTKEELPKHLKVAIPRDPTNMDRAIRILASYGYVSIPETDRLLKVADAKNAAKDIEFLPVAIPSLVQAYKESDLAFNWPAHMRKIGVSVEDALLLEGENNNKFAIILAAREDNKDSRKIHVLLNAMRSKEVREFLEKNYKDQGYPVF